MVSIALSQIQFELDILLQLTNPIINELTEQNEIEIFEAYFFNPETNELKQISPAEFDKHQRLKNIFLKECRCIEPEMNTFKTSPDELDWGSPFEADRMRFETKLFHAILRAEGLDYLQHHKIRLGCQWLQQWSTPFSFEWFACDIAFRIFQIQRVLDGIAPFMLENWTRDVLEIGKSVAEINWRRRNYDTLLSGRRQKNGIVSAHAARQKRVPRNRKSRRDALISLWEEMSHAIPEAARFDVRMAEEIVTFLKNNPTDRRAQALFIKSSGLLLGVDAIRLHIGRLRKAGAI